MTEADERTRLKHRVLSLIESLSHGRHNVDARDELLADVFRYQAARVAPYRRWIDHRSPEETDPLRWPGLPTDVFRHTRVASFAEENEQRVFLTSGTTHGARGRHALTDLSLYDHAARTAAAHALFFDGKRRLIVLGPSEHEAPESSLAYMIARFADWFGVGSTTYAWRSGRLDPSALMRALTRSDEPVALLGTSFAWVHALDAVPRIGTPKGSWAMLTGGFKGKSREVDADELRGGVAERFSLSERAVVGEYGMTELSSQLYEPVRRSAHAPRRYWVPGWVRASVVDPETLTPLRDGDSGLLRLDDPANLDSVAAIQTSDLARLIDGTVELVGRAPGAALRGCSLAVEEALQEATG